MRRSITQFWEVVQPVSFFVHQLDKGFRTGNNTHMQTETTCPALPKSTYCIGPSTAQRYYGGPALCAAAPILANPLRVR